MSLDSCGDLDRVGLGVKLDTSLKMHFTAGVGLRLHPLQPQLLLHGGERENG